MERQKQEKAKKKIKGVHLPSPAATAAFLILALLLVFGTVRLLKSAIDKRLSQSVPEAAVQQEGSAGVQKKIEQTPYDEPAREAAAMLLPTRRPVPTDIAKAAEGGEAEASAEPGAAVPTETPLPEGVQKLKKAQFSAERSDVVLLCFDEEGFIDIAALSVMREEEWTLVFMPKNTLDAAGKPISRQRSARAALLSIETIIPVDFTWYIEMQLSGLSDLVDAAGGLMLYGDAMSGDAARAYIETDGSDELIRLGRAQTLLSAYLSRFPALGIIRLAATRAILTRCAKGNLSTEQYLTLFSNVRKSGTVVDCMILPVDSLEQNGLRCYRADPDLTCQFVANTY